MARVNLGKVVGRSAYEEAVRLGFVGSEEDWLLSIEGDSAFDIAKKNGFIGTEQDWLNSIKGKTAYESAKSGGFEGTEMQFNLSLASIGQLNNILDYINGGI